MSNAQKWQPAEFPMPHWEDLCLKARDEGADNAQRSRADGAVVLSAGFEPPGLRSVCARRSALLEKLAEHLHIQRDRAGEHLAGHQEIENTRATERATITRFHDQARTVVQRLSARPSQRPGDGYASELAVKGGLRRRLKRDGGPFLILLILLCIEIPIYYETFLQFGDRPEMSALFAIGAITVFVFGPHLYGRMFRVRQEDGRADIDGYDNEGRRWMFRPSVVTILPLVWLAAITVVASIRAKSLVRPRQVADPATGLLRPLESFAQEIGFWPVFVLLLAIVVITGLVAAETGRRMGNPNDRLLKQQRARLEELAGKLGAVNEQAKADREYRSMLERVARGDDPRHGQMVKQIQLRYDEVEESFIMGFVSVTAEDSPAAVKAVSTIVDNHKVRRH
ncbi:hypothetical protein [Nonomuraea lactucae]|uniref:hypothetical protein n=1 Tax=Nonomuraea lactucae TaxID=2249762 RepID=UPI0013B3A4B4|nr:hypothetical protein [Nonomuraea lactucae]